MKTTKKVSVFKALQYILHGTIGGLVVAAVLTSSMDIRDPKEILEYGSVIGSLAGYLATLVWL